MLFATRHQDAADHYNTSDPDQHGFEAASHLMNAQWLAAFMTVRS